MSPISPTWANRYRRPRGGTHDGSPRSDTPRARRRMIAEMLFRRHRCWALTGLSMPRSPSTADTSASARCCTRPVPRNARPRPPAARTQRSERRGRRRRGHAGRQSSPARRLEPLLARGHRSRGDGGDAASGRGPFPQTRSWRALVGSRPCWMCGRVCWRRGGRWPARLWKLRSGESSPIKVRGDDDAPHGRHGDGRVGRVSCLPTSVRFERHR